jgi:hypothetical protein
LGQLEKTGSPVKLLRAEHRADHLDEIEPLVSHSAVR